MSGLAGLEDDLPLFDRLAERLEELGLLNEMELAEDDASVEQEIAEGIKALRAELDDLDIRTLLGGEYDERYAIVSIHPGAGGTESQDWAEMLFRMILRWAERRRFKGNKAKVELALAKGKRAFD